MKNVKLWVLGVLVIVVGAGAAVTLVNKEREGAPKEAAEPKAIPVKFVHARKGALERLCTQPGSVHSFESIQLYAKVSGFLERQKVDIGDTVKKGDVLAKLYVPDLEAQVDRNRASVAKAESILKQMHARLKVATAHKKAADAEVNYAKAMEKVAVPYLAYREKQFARISDLVERKTVEERLRDESMQQKDAAFETLVAAGVKITTAEANVIAAEAKIEQTEADVKEAEAEIEVTEAELKKSLVNLDFATITAPFDGKITYRSMNPWDFVRSANEGGNPLLTVRRTDLFRVIVLVPDRDVEMIEVGMPTRMTIDSLPNRVFYPKVARIANALDAHTRLMRVELDLYHDKEGKICSAQDIRKVFHDMYGQVTIALDRGKNRLSIPTSCIVGKVEDGKGSVYVIRDGKPRKIEVKVGLDSGLRLVVEKVLTPGETLTESDEVIVEPSSDLARGPAVSGTLWDDASTIKLIETER